jgi:plasmid stability protein
MGQLIIRNLDDEVIETLRDRAKKAKKSLEQSVREILIASARPDKQRLLEEMRRFRSGIPPTVLDATDLVREDRDR